ncbi:hypothetical protein [Aeromonas sp. OTU364]|uniref:hypothetical protein n=1 Tax=Aeromonas sp. OTU364 TaxID=3043864 RepID=UPI00313C537D
MKDKLKMNPGETLKRVHFRTKGTMGQTEIETLSILSPNGEVVGEVVYTDHTNLRGLQRQQHVCQTDLEGNVIVDERW